MVEWTTAENFKNSLQIPSPSKVVALLCNISICLCTYGWRSKVFERYDYHDILWVIARSL